MPQPGKPKGTSRRQFAKSTAGALIAAPLAVPAGQDKQKIMSMHDTPPHLVFINGSFIVETETEFMEVSGPQDPILKYKIRPAGGSSRVTAEHVRLVRGNGEAIKLISHDRGCSGKIILSDNSEITFTGGDFEIQTPRVKQFNQGNAANLDKPSSKKRQFRYRANGSQALSIKEVIITPATGRPYSYNLESQLQVQARHDFKIMVWLHQS